LDNLRTRAQKPASANIIAADPKGTLMDAMPMQPSKREPGREDQRMMKILPYLEMLNQIRQSRTKQEDRKKIDVLTVLVAKMSSQEVKRGELVVDFCRSKAISVSEYTRVVNLPECIWYIESRPTQGN
jgi:predicted secreted protein